MTPSIFNNEYSRGPLYQYWKERSVEEKATRDQRIEEAKIRSKGFQPLSPAPGPSSYDSYMRRATSGPPGYITATGGSAAGSGSVDERGLLQSSCQELSPNTAASAAAARPSNGDLPSYIDATGSPAAATASGPSQPSSTSQVDSQEAPLLSSADEKARLAQLEAQRRQIEEDAAIASTLSASEAEPAEWQPSSASDNNNSQGRTRRKSTASKVGRWLADAASGYSKKQERF